MKTDIIEYQKARGISEIEVFKQRLSLNELLKVEKIIWVLIIFLIGRAAVMHEFVPLAMAIYTASTLTNIKRISAGIILLSGIITTGYFEHMYIVIISIFLFEMFFVSLGLFKTKTEYKIAFISLASTLIPYAILWYLQGRMIYDLLIAVFYGASVFVLFFIFKETTSSLKKKNHEVLTTEQIISVAITISLALSGFSNIYIAGFSLVNILSILIILTISYKFGPAIGAATGVTIGMIISISSDATPLIIGSYSFCGLISGILNKFGKIGSCIGFVMANSILTIYLNGSTEVIIFLNEILCALAIFLLIPEKYLKFLTNKIRKENSIFDKNIYSLKVREVTIEKLKKFSKVFSNLSKVVDEAYLKPNTENSELPGLFESIADRICKNCKLRTYCWETNFYNTYQAMFQVVEKIDEKGQIDINNVPDYFSKKCIKIEKFIKEVNTLYELFKINTIWKNRVNESQGIISKQMEIMSKMISRLANNVGMKLTFKKEKEDLILKAFQKEGHAVDEVLVMEKNDGNNEIVIHTKRCDFKKKDIKVFEKVVSEVMGKMFIQADRNISLYSTAKNCCIKFIEEEKLAVTIGTSYASKHNEKVCGDSKTFFRTDEGKYIIALSDGMGSGSSACAKSKKVIDMFEQFIESGLDKDTSIKIINLMLGMNVDDLSFATIDVSIIDLHNGNVEFVKVGACPTYVRRKEKVEVVRVASLPAGLISNIDLEFAHIKINSGDIIVMCTDGIIESFEKNNEGSFFEEFIMENDTKNPQELADIILKEALICDGNAPADDMTVIVAKVWERIK